MEAFVKDQILATLKHAPFHMVAGQFKKGSSAEVEACRRQLGGFVKGTCHPSERYAQIKGAGIGWIRPDVAFPFDQAGGPRQEYADWKEKMRRYRENGIRIMAVTPYPSEYIKYGIDPRTPRGEARVKEIAAFLIKDLRGVAGGFQITNEMGIPHFTLPLNMKEAARFIGVQLEAMYPHRGNILIGYNSAGPQCDLHALLRPWLQYCDYVGIDIYIGCFFGVACWMGLFDAMLRYLWSMTGKPILLMEFGYISGGAPKTPEEKRAVLRRYGMSSEREAREKLDLFMENIKNINEKMWERVTKNASGGYADYIFKSDYKNHFYTELPKRTVIKKYPHTPQGQAGFYRDIFPRLAGLPFLLGAFVYCWKDGEKCGYCGQADCPQETRWGLVDTQHREKPSYHAVRDALAKIK